MDFKKLEELLKQKLQVTNIAAYLNDKLIYWIEYDNKQIGIYEVESKKDFVDHFMNGLKNKEYNIIRLYDAIVALEGAQHE